MNTKKCESRGTNELSVTRLFNDLQSANSSAAAHELWYFLRRRLVNLSKREVAWAKPTVYDEEDVALSAFSALCVGRQAGRYAEVSDRDEIWRLLAVIAINKARKRRTRENRIRRGGGFDRMDDDGKLLESFISSEPAPEFRMAMEEECQRLLGLLKKPELKMVALLKVEGYTNEETARMLGCTRRAVQRRLALIRDFWSEEINS